MALPPIILGKNNQLLNGSHRLASALNKGWPIKFKHGDFSDGQDMVTLDYFNHLGLFNGEKRQRDTIIKYGLWASRKQILIVIWNNNFLDEIKEFIDNAGLNIVCRYQSQHALSDYSSIQLENLIRLIYCDHPWMFNNISQPIGAQEKSYQISSNNRCSILLLEEANEYTNYNSLARKTVEMKKNFRDRSKTGHSALHTADNFLQTWAISTSLFNSSHSYSICNLFEKRPQKGMFNIQGIPNMLTSIDEYWSYAITGSTAMKYYGIDIEPKDLDLVCSNSSVLNPIYNHSTEEKYYPISLHEIATSGCYTYTHMGVRVLKPSTLYLMKKTRNEIKDQQHCLEIELALKKNSSQPLKFELVVYK